MARCLVVGSVAQDEVLELREPLRAGAHLEASDGVARLGGGAAGTGLPLAYAGHHVTLVSPLGTDKAGEWLLEQLRAAGIDTSQVMRVEGPSTRSLVLLDPDGERTIINLHRCREPGPPQRLLGLEADCVYVRSRDLDLAPLLAEKARSALVVAHVPPVAHGSRPTHVLVASESDLPPEALASPWALGSRVAGAHLRWIVITRGARGAEAFSADRRLSAPAPAVKALDTTSAGDAFAAGLVHALLSGTPIERALEIAVTWGAAAVGCRGLPTREVIAGLLQASAARGIQ